MLKRKSESIGEETTFLCLEESESTGEATLLHLQRISFSFIDPPGIGALVQAHFRHPLDQCRWSGFASHLGLPLFDPGLRIPFILCQTNAFDVTTCAYI